VVDARSRLARPVFLRYHHVHQHSSEVTIMKRVWGLLAIIIIASSSLHAGDKRPIVAVFDVQAKRVKLSMDMLDALADYLASRLTETGKYQIVPRDQLKERLVKQKKSSYKQCYDKKCQIEMGRELAAEKTVSAQVNKFADICTLSVTIYDLKKAATESAATEKGGCGEKDLLGLLDRAVNKLVGIGTSPSIKIKNEVTKKTERGKAGIEWVMSKPAGIDFTRSEVTVAQYGACVKAGNCSTPDTGGRCNWSVNGRDNHPINCVDWNQATAFCEWAGGRLPTEDEWYAEASNGGKREYTWGDKAPTCDYAVMSQGGVGGRQDENAASFLVGCWCVYQQPPIQGGAA